MLVCKQYKKMKILTMSTFKIEGEKALMIPKNLKMHKNRE